MGWQLMRLEIWPETVESDTCNDQGADDKLSSACIFLSTLKENPSFLKHTVATSVAMDVLTITIMEDSPIPPMMLQIWMSGICLY